MQKSAPSHVSVTEYILSGSAEALRQIRLHYVDDVSRQSNHEAFSTTLCVRSFQGPSIKLDFSMYSTLIKHGPKQTSIPVTGSDPVTLKDVGGPYLELQDKASLRDSVQMSWELLATMNTYREPRYGKPSFRVL